MRKLSQFQAAPLAVISALALVFALASCDPNDSDDGGGGGINSVKDTQLKKTDGSNYPGTGSVQDVKGKTKAGSSSWNITDAIGTISADGKLTLNLPSSIDESHLAHPDELADIPADVKTGYLEIFAPKDIYPYKKDASLPYESADEYTIFYANKAFSATVEEHTFNFKTGWNFVLGSAHTVTTSVNDIIWVIQD